MSINRFLNRAEIEWLTALVFGDPPDSGTERCHNAVQAAPIQRGPCNEQNT